MAEESFMDDLSVSTENPIYDTDPQKTINHYEKTNLAPSFVEAIRNLILSSKGTTMTADAVINPIWDSTPVDIVKMKSFIMYQVFHLTLPAIHLEKVDIITFGLLGELLDDLDKTDLIADFKDRYLYELRVVVEMMLYYYNGLDGLKYLLGRRYERPIIVKKLYKSLRAYVTSKGHNLDQAEGNWRLFIDTAQKAGSRPPTSWQSVLQFRCYGIDFPRYQGIELRFQDIPKLLAPYLSLDLIGYPLLIKSKSVEANNSLNDCEYRTPQWHELMKILPETQDLLPYRGSMRSKEAYKEIYGELAEISYSECTDDPSEESRDLLNNFHLDNAPHNSKPESRKNVLGLSEKKLVNFSNNRQSGTFVEEKSNNDIWNKGYSMFLNWLRSKGVIMPEACLPTIQTDENEVLATFQAVFTFGQSINISRNTNCKEPTSTQPYIYKVAHNTERPSRSRTPIKHQVAHRPDSSRRRSLSLVKTQKGSKPVTNTHIETLISMTQSDSSNQKNDIPPSDHCPVLEAVRRVYRKDLLYAGFYSLKSFSIKLALAETLGLREDLCKNLVYKKEAMKILDHEHLWGIMPWTDLYYLKKHFGKTRDYPLTRLLTTIDNYYTLKSKGIKTRDRLDGLKAIFDEATNKALGLC